MAGMPSGSTMRWCCVSSSRRGRARCSTSSTGWAGAGPSRCSTTATTGQRMAGWWRVWWCPRKSGTWWARRWTRLVIGIGTRARTRRIGCFWAEGRFLVPHAPRHKRTRSVQTGIPTRSMGTIVFSLTTIVPHAPAWECSSRRSASLEDAERPDRYAHAEHGHDSVLPDDYRSSRSSMGMQLPTLCVARGRGASRPAYPRGARAR
ncbi:hypothetical protein ALP50_102344 [Pseudomonas syringae pv. spinaceae]|nr:hypothetical protein ALP50_102344 [Pseudomonas syringae pv. spinaceae]